MGGARAYLGLAAVLLGAGCAPVPVERAEEICLREAELAQRPRGTLALGVTSERGTSGSLGLEISSDYLMGRDPAEVYNRCVFNKSGQFPTRPLYSRTDWKG
ncbi:hypothetical protein [Pontitalea aquivivens]|uniref:hypothetical protein n=1 Tax=Pontitalea aquivivens TaxID=3388663 RepID=UPI003970FF9D